MLIKLKKCQSTAEYAILFALVVAAAMGVQTYVKRSLQAAVKERADEFVRQVTADSSGAKELQWEAASGYKTTTNQQSNREFTEDYESGKDPFIYREDSSADFSSDMNQ